jgi:hypothetical protein
LQRISPTYKYQNSSKKRKSGSAANRIPEAKKTKSTAEAKGKKNEADESQPDEPKTKKSTTKSKQEKDLNALPNIENIILEAKKAMPSRSTQPAINEPPI